MARREIVHIEEGGVSSKDFRFVTENAAPSLKHAYEQVLSERMFGLRGNSCERSELRESFYVHVSDIQQAIYDDCVARGLFPTNPNSTRIHYVGVGMLLILIAGVFSFGTYLFASRSVPALVAIPAVWGMLALVLLALSTVMLRKTIKGAQQAATVRAFKRHLEQTQKYVTTPEAKARFDTSFPFALAFGIEKKLVQDFARVDTPAPGWYVPRHRRPIISTTGGFGGDSGGGMPSLDTMAGNMADGLNSTSAGLMRMLNETSSTVVSTPAPDLSTRSRGGAKRRWRRWRRFEWLWLSKGVVQHGQQQNGRHEIERGGLIFIVVGGWMLASIAEKQTERAAFFCPTHL